MLAAAREGSNRAWAALLERVDPECRRLAHLVLGGHDVDRTLVSAYVRAYRARRKGPDDAVVFLTHHVWITCGHELRRQQRRRAPAPGRRPVQAERPARFGSTPLGTAIAGLRPEERAVWGLIDEAGLPVAAVADALGVDRRVVTTVASRVARTLDRALAVPVTGPDPDDPDDPDDTDVAPTETSDDGAGDAPTDDAAGDVPTGDTGEGEGADGVSHVPELDHPGEDTEAVMVTEASTDAAPAADGDGPPVDDGDVEPEPPTPAFWNELGRRLRAEREAPQAAPPPPLPEPGAPPPSLTKAKAPPVAMQKRAPAKSRRRRPDVVEGLADEVDRQRPRRSWGRLLLRVAAVLAALALIGGVVFALYRAASDARSPVRGETVAEAAAQSMTVLAESPTWSATVERQELSADAGMVRSTVQVVATPDGSFRVQESPLGRLTTFDNTAGTLQDTLPGFPPRNETGVAFGGIEVDGGPPRAGNPIDDLALAARALAPIDDAEPEADELNGTDVLLLEAPLDDQIDLTYAIDADTYTPVRITWTVDGSVVRELRFADVELAALPPELTQDVGGGPQVDMGWARVGVTQAEGRTGIAPLTPAYLPEGFVPFNRAAVHEQDRVTTLRYTRGPQELLVTVRPSPVAEGDPWDDPFARPEGTEVVPTEVVLEDGAFRGTTALLVSGPRDLPSIWGADGETAFTVSGDLPADELEAVAASLR